VSPPAIGMGLSVQDLMRQASEGPGMWQFRLPLEQGIAETKGGAAGDSEETVSQATSNATV
jgi:hypothetical protein